MLSRAASNPLRIARLHFPRLIADNLPMPLYEYVSQTDGTVIELLRPIAQADDPVSDPEGKGRTFVRRHSTFATGAAASGASSSAPSGACCPCGKRPGSCASGN